MNRIFCYICILQLCIGCLPHDHLNREDIAKIEFYKFIMLYNCNAKGFVQAGASIIISNPQKEYDMLKLDIKIDTIIQDKEHDKYLMHFCHPNNPLIGIVPFDTKSLSVRCHGIVFKKDSNIPYCYIIGEDMEFYIDSVGRTRMDSLFSVYVKNNPINE